MMLFVEIWLSVRDARALRQQRQREDTERREALAKISKLAPAGRQALQEAGNG